MSKNKVHSSHDSNEIVESDMKIWDCGSPLYDSYELASVSQLIERHLMFLPSSLGGGSKQYKSLLHHGIGGRASKADVVVVAAASMVSSSEVKGDYMVFGRLSGCIGSYSLWKILRGERIMKIKFNKFGLFGIKWFT